MHAPVYIYDPTQTDALSKVRGVGRYVQILRENAPGDWIFTASTDAIPSHAFLILPFFTFYQKPFFTRRITDMQIAVIHDMIPQKYPAHFPVGIKGMIYNKWSEWSLKTQVDYILTDSETSKNDIVALLKVPDTKISVLYPTLAKTFWEQSAPQSIATGNYAIYVGDGTWNKNLVAIARAIQQSNITCMFVGKLFEDPDPQSYSNPWQSEIRDFFQIAQFDKRFIFTGYVSDQQLFRLYQQARVNLLVSRDEGFGFSFLEAAAFGCPSILADRPIFREIAGDAAVFCNPDDVTSLSNALSLLFSDNALRTRTAQRAWEQIKKYSVAKFRHQLSSVVYGTRYSHG